jgi:two-component system, LytTR family, response regulator
LTREADAGETVGVLIVDDEQPARAILREFLERVGGVRVVGECGNGLDALRAAGALSPAIVFLDIEMPKLDGFEVLELLDPAVAAVFVTAYDAYAVKAFEVHAVDYVLKPYAPERIAAAVERARERLRVKETRRPEGLAVAARPEGSWLTRIVVRDGARIHIIPAGALVAAQAQDDYVALRSDGRTYLKAETLSSLAASLDPKRFVRVHRSHLVNLDFVTRLEGGRLRPVAVLADGSRVPVSRQGHARLKALLGSPQ